MVNKLTPDDFNLLWDLTKSVYLTPPQRQALTLLLVERAELANAVVSSSRPLPGFSVACPCGDSGKPGHPVEGYCRKGIGGV